MYVDIKIELMYFWWIRNEDDILEIVIFWGIFPSSTDTIKFFRVMSFPSLSGEKRTLVVLEFWIWIASFILWLPSWSLGGLEVEFFFIVGLTFGVFSIIWILCHSEFLLSSCVCEACSGAGELVVVLVTLTVTERRTLLWRWWWRTRLQRRRHEMQVQSPCQKDALGEDMAAHSSPGFSPGESHGQRSVVGYNSPWGCRVGHDWSDLSALPLPVPWCVTNHFNLHHRLWSRYCYNSHFPVDETEVQKCAGRVRVRGRWWDSCSGHRNTALRCVRPCSDLACAAW